MNIVKEGSAKEVQASKISIHRNGIIGLFCGQYNIALINLEDNKIKIQTVIGRKSKEISVCQWNKHGDNVAIGVNNVCKIFDSDMNKIQSLICYNQPLSSIDWHPGSKHQLISSSYDNIKSICLWDIRNPKFPSGSIDIDKVQQVKWHEFNANIFASSSNSDIRLWDRRNLTSSIHTISAHLSYVSDFDWVPREDYSIISCGLYDGKIKLWSINDDNLFLQFQEDEHESLCRCSLNQTGCLLMTLTVTEASSANQLILWDTSSGFDFRKLLSSSLNINSIIDFKWRNISSENNQIVSLHKNYDYKIWTVDSSNIKIKKRTKESSFKIPDNSNSSNGLYFSRSPLSVGELSSNITTVFSETFSKSKTNELMENILPRYSDSNLSIKSKTARMLSSDLDLKIQKEFEKLANSIYVMYEKNPKERRVIAHLVLVSAKSSIMFSYRGLTVESLSLDVSVLAEKSDKLRKQNLDELEKIIKNIAGKNVFGISKCVDGALDYLNKLSTRINPRSLRATKESTSGTYCSLPDIKIPYPRTCGAKFSPSGLLVCFISPPGVKSKYHITPRSFVDIAKHSSDTASGKDFLYSFNPGPTKPLSQRSFKTVHKKNKITRIPGDMDSSSKMHSLPSLQKYNFNVYIYNAQRLSLFCPSLAKNYSIDVSDIELMCEVNAAAVTDSNRKDLTEFWHYCTILAQATHPNINDFNSPFKPWPSQLLGRQMCFQWLDHFLKILDIQSASMLILVMFAVDYRFDLEFETKYNFSSVLNKSKNPSMEFGYDSFGNDNTIRRSLNSFTNLTFDGLKFYKLYHDESNAALIISSSSFEAQNKHLGEADHQCGVTKTSNKFTEVMLHHRESCRLIDPSKLTQYSLIVLHYSRILSAQGMLTTATKISRKILPVTFFSNLSIQDQFSVRFMRMSSDSSSGRVDDTNIPAIFTDCSQRAVPPCAQDQTPRTQVMCSICRLHVHGLLSICALCNHGGHIDHIMSWFSRTSSQGVCPTGCGCHCSLGLDNLQELAQSIPI